MNQNEPQNKERTSYLRKCANEISARWRQANLPPVANDLFRMLSSAFGCFAVALFLLALFTAKPLDNVLLLWLSGFSLLLSIFLLIAVSISRCCQVFYTCAKILERYLVVFWILMLIPVTALGKIMDVLGNMAKTSGLEPYLPVIKVVLIVCGVFFVAYFIAVIWLSFRSAKSRTPLSVKVAFWVSFLTWLLIILSDRWPTQFQTELYGYMILLTPVVILLSIYVKKAGNQQRTIPPALAIVVTVFVLLGIGWLLSACSCWIWFCFGLLTIAIILLGVGIIRLGGVSNSQPTETA